MMNDVGEAMCANLFALDCDATITKFVIVAIIYPTLIWFCSLGMTPKSNLSIEESSFGISFRHTLPFWLRNTTLAHVSYQKTKDMSIAKMQGESMGMPPDMDPALFAQIMNLPMGSGEELGMMGNQQ